MMTLAEIVCASYIALSFPNAGMLCNNSDTLVQASQKNNLDPFLMISLIYVESRWRPTAVSSAGACGLTQVIPKYTGGKAIKKKYTCNQLKDPRTSISAGAKILRWWIDYHKGNIKQGLCGYNAGFRCSYKKNKKGKIVKTPNKHGMRYARKVLRIQKKLKNKSLSLNSSREK